MFAFFLTSFLALLAIVNPFIILPPFLGLTKNCTPEDMADTARKACGVAGGILIAFTFLGDRLLKIVGVSHGALVIAGGILLFTAAFGMAMGSNEDADDPSSSRKVKASDVAVFPLGFPIITGPAAISVVIANLAEVGGGLTHQLAMSAAVVLLMSLVFVCCLFAKPLLRMLGTSSVNIMQRLVGLVLAGIAAQMTVSGIEKVVTEYRAKTTETVAA